MNSLDEFNVGEIENKDAQQALRAIEDGNGSLFMEVTPEPVHNFYDAIINEYNAWSGRVIPQFEPSKYPEIK